MEGTFEEIKPKNFKFGAIGNYIIGTLTKVGKTTSLDKWGKYSWIYSVRTKEGKFLGSTTDEKSGKSVPDKEETVIGEGENYSVFIPIEKDVVTGKMNDIKIGQKFKIQFVETKPTSKGNDAKIIKVFAGKDKDGNRLMDEAWLADQAGTLDEL